MFEKFAYAKTLVEELKNKSAELDCKVDDVQEIVANFKCAFKSLEEDVTVLESAESELLALEKEAEIQIKQHGVESECDFEDLLTLVESKKEEVDNIKEMAIPCGGLGWKRVEYQDFRNRPCYFGFYTFSDESHLCGVPNEHECREVTISIDDMEYNSVCGRIKAFQYGTPNGFNPEPFLKYVYLTGISLTHGEPATHIWSFVAGHSQTGTPNATRTCPCDGGAPSPSFVGEDYFCEAAITRDISSDPFKFDDTLFLRNPLWDGQGCIASSTCCSRQNHPYFIKHLETSTTDNINLRICIQGFSSSENILLEIVELYVKFTD